MPFLVINTLLLVVAVFVPDHRALFLAALFWHTSATAGDFALLNYLYLNRQREIYAYDDADNKISYFYAGK
jgi:hypothetical protein